jgi:hypothetical protein
MGIITSNVSKASTTASIYLIISSFAFATLAIDSGVTPALIMAEYKFPSPV